MGGGKEVMEMVVMGGGEEVMVVMVGGGEEVMVVMVGGGGGEEEEEGGSSVDVAHSWALDSMTLVSSLVVSTGISPISSVVGMSESENKCANRILVSDPVQSVYDMGYSLPIRTIILDTNMREHFNTIEETMFNKIKLHQTLF